MLKKISPFRHRRSRPAIKPARLFCIATFVAISVANLPAIAGDITDAPSTPISTAENNSPATASLARGSAFRKLQDISGRASELAMHAFGLLGIRYRMGGNTPENGLDCSGLVRYVFKQAWGTELPRTADELSRVGETVQAHELQPGDLVFYNTLRKGFSHVGIYLGDNKFIHSPSAGGQVRIESMDISYWRTRFNGARRIVDPVQN